MRKWLISSGLLVAVVALLWAPASSRIDAYLRDRVESTLREDFASELDVAKFDVSIFPLGVQVEGLVLRHHGRTDVPPLISIQEFSASARLLEMLFRRPIHVNKVTARNVHIVIPPRSEQAGGNNNSPPERRKPFPLIADEIYCENVQLDLLPFQDSRPARVFRIHSLDLTSGGPGQPMPFQASLTNPTPSGEIQTKGRFGPWYRDIPALTPVAGEYVFSHANLDDIKGLGGILSSHGKFSGVLQRIEVDGETSTPQFSLDLSNHPVPLETQFHAIVDGTNGNTLLDPVRARLLSSTIVARGGVFKAPGAEHRTVRLQASGKQAKLEDLLFLATKQPKPAMLGFVTFQTEIDIPPGPESISKRLQLKGRFETAQARLTDLNLEEKVAELSRRGSGRVKKAERNANTNVISNLTGMFELHEGVMNFSKLTFAVPGALASLDGSYILDQQSVDFQGTLSLSAKLSQTTTGWKSLLLKAVDPLFKGQNAGTVLPIKVSGTGNHPEFALDFGRILKR